MFWIVILLTCAWVSGLPCAAATSPDTPIYSKCLRRRLYERVELSSQLSAPDCCGSGEVARRVAVAAAFYACSVEQVKCKAARFLLAPANAASALRVAADELLTAALGEGPLPRPANDSDASGDGSGGWLNWGLVESWEAWEDELMSLLAAGGLQLSAGGSAGGGEGGALSRTAAFLAPHSLAAHLLRRGALVDASGLAALDPALQRWGVHPTLAQLSIMGGQTLGVPLDGSQLLLFLRADVFSASGLPPPASWQELLQTAERLNGTSTPTGTGAAGASDQGPLFGFCLPPPRLLGSLALAVLAPMVQTNGTREGMYLDPSSLRPAAATLAMSYALSYLRRLATLSPHSASSPTSAAPPYSEAFARGRCAMTVGSAAQFRRNSHADHPEGPSAVRGQVLASLLPGSELVLSEGQSSAGDSLVPCTPGLCPNAVATEASAKGAPGDATAGTPGLRRSLRRGLQQGAQALVNRAPLLSPDGLVGAIAAGGEVTAQLLSWSLLSSVGGPSTSWELLLPPGSEVGPWRQEHFQDAQRWAAAGYHAADTASFLRAAQGSLDHPNVVWPLRVEGAVTHNRAVSTAAEAVVALATAPSPPSGGGYGAGEVAAGDPRVAAAVGALAEAVTALYGAGQPDPALRAAYLDSLPGYRTGSLSPNELDAPGAQASAHSSATRTGLIVGLVTACVVVLAGALALGYCVRRRGRAAGASYWALVEAPPPGPATCIAVTDIEGSTSLWEALPEAVLDRALRTHHRVVRTTSSRYRGYESATEGDSFILAFATPAAAASFAVVLQQALLEAEWPAELLAAPSCRPVYVTRREEVERAESVSLTPPPAAKPQKQALLPGSGGVMSPHRGFGSPNAAGQHHNVWHGYRAAVMALTGNRAAPKPEPAKKHSQQQQRQQQQQQPPSPAGGRGFPGRHPLKRSLSVPLQVAGPEHGNSTAVPEHGSKAKPVALFTFAPAMLASRLRLGRSSTDKRLQSDAQPAASSQVSRPSAGGSMPGGPDKDRASSFGGQFLAATRRAVSWRPGGTSQLGVGVEGAVEELGNTRAGGRPSAGVLWRPPAALGVMEEDSADANVHEDDSEDEEADDAPAASELLVQLMLVARQKRNLHASELIPVAENDGSRAGSRRSTEAGGVNTNSLSQQPARLPRPQVWMGQRQPTSSTQSSSALPDLGAELAGSFLPAVAGTSRCGSRPQSAAAAVQLGVATAGPLGPAERCSRATVDTQQSSAPQLPSLSQLVLPTASQHGRQAIRASSGDSTASLVQGLFSRFMSNGPGASTARLPTTLEEASNQLSPPKLPVKFPSRLAMGAAAHGGDGALPLLARGSSARAELHERFRSLAAESSRPNSSIFATANRSRTPTTSSRQLDGSTTCGGVLPSGAEGSAAGARVLPTGSSRARLLMSGIFTAGYDTLMGIMAHPTAEPAQRSTAGSMELHGFLDRDSNVPSRQGNNGFSTQRPASHGEARRQALRAPGVAAMLLAAGQQQPKNGGRLPAPSAVRASSAPTGVSTPTATNPPQVADSVHANGIQEGLHDPPVPPGMTKASSYNVSPEPKFGRALTRHISQVFVAAPTPYQPTPGSLLAYIHRLFSTLSSANPVSASQTEVVALVFAGLRVRVGLHCGVQAHEIVYNPASARQTFGGEALRIAKGVTDCASGGQVVLSGEVLAQVQLAGDLSDLPGVMMDLGDHQLFESVPHFPALPPTAMMGSEVPPLPAPSPAPAAPSIQLLQLVSAPLLGRLALMPPFRPAIHQYTPGFMDAPVGESIAVVVFRVAHASAILSWDAAVAAESLALLELFLRASLGRLLPSASGSHGPCYLAAAPPGCPLGTFVAVFANPAAAAKWALEASSQLEGLPWPQGLLESRFGAPLEGLSRAEAEARDAAAAPRHGPRQGLIGRAVSKAVPAQQAGLEAKPVSRTPHSPLAPQQSSQAGFVVVETEAFRRETTELRVNPDDGNYRSTERTSSVLGCEEATLMPVGATLSRLLESTQSLESGPPAGTGQQSMQHMVRLPEEAMTLEDVVDATRKGTAWKPPLGHCSGLIRAQDSGCSEVTLMDGGVSNDGGPCTLEPSRQALQHDRCPRRVQASALSVSSLHDAIATHLPSSGAAALAAAARRPAPASAGGRGPTPQLPRSTSYRKGLGARIMLSLHGSFSVSRPSHSNVSAQGTPPAARSAAHLLLEAETSGSPPPSGTGAAGSAASFSSRALALALPRAFTPGVGGSPRDALTARGPSVLRRKPSLDVGRSMARLHESPAALAAAAVLAAEDAEVVTLRGLRVRAGLAVGAVRVELCPMTGRVVYSGKPVTAAMTAAAAARLGTLYATQGAATAVEAREEASEPSEAAPGGNVGADGATGVAGALQAQAGADWAAGPSLAVLPPRLVSTPTTSHFADSGSTGGAPLLVRRKEAFLRFRLVARGEDMVGVTRPREL